MPKNGVLYSIGQFLLVHPLLLRILYGVTVYVTSLLVGWGWLAGFVLTTLVFIR